MRKKQAPRRILSDGLFVSCRAVLWGVCLATVAAGCTGSAWSANEIAVANALAADGRLAAGQMVKVAISEPHQGRL